MLCQISRIPVVFPKPNVPNDGKFRIAKCSRSSTIVVAVKVQEISALRFSVLSAMITTPSMSEYFFGITIMFFWLLVRNSTQNLSTDGYEPDLARFTVPVHSDGVSPGRPTNLGRADSDLVLPRVAQGIGDAPKSSSIVLNLVRLEREQKTRVSITHSGN